jgi:hypothetical protein
MKKPFLSLVVAGVKARWGWNAGVSNHGTLELSGAPVRTAFSIQGRRTMFLKIRRGQTLI